jgi:hypothetical protein
METIEFDRDRISSELETKLRDMLSAGKKPADAVFEINKRILANYMRENKIDLVFAGYSGSEDNGCVDVLVFYRGDRKVSSPKGLLSLVFVGRRYHKDGDIFKFTTFDTDARNSFERMTDDALDLCGHGGWEINDGGYGEARFKLENPEDEAVVVQVTHNTYITDVETDSYDL